MPDIEVWSQFAHDPRVASNAPMRASDRDREVIATILGNAFAEGRLTHGEYDERADAALASRTLGDLMPLVADLPVAASTPRTSIADLAARSYVSASRQAVWTFISVSLICWVIWLATSFGGDGFNAQFPWPLFVMLGTGLHAGRVRFRKDEIIEEETRRLEKKKRYAIPKRDEG